MRPQPVKIEVAVRVCPFDPSEDYEEAAQSAAVDLSCISVDATSQHGTKAGLSVRHPLTGISTTYNPDHVLWSLKNLSSGSHYCSQRGFFQQVVMPKLESLWEGFNAAVVAYGESRAGKSYSILGGGTSASAGALPRASQYLFDRMAANACDPRLKFELAASVLQVANDQAVDLLSPSLPIPAPLKVTLHDAVGAHVSGLTRCHVASQQHLMEVLQAALQAQIALNCTAGTAPSRVHTAFHLHLTQYRPGLYDEENNPLNESMDSIASLVNPPLGPGASGPQEQVVSTLSFFDLAASYYPLGDERAPGVGSAEGPPPTAADPARDPAAHAGARGSFLDNGRAALRASVAVLASLGTGDPGAGEDLATPAIASRIGYDASTLTMLLRDVLQGNTRTTVVAAVSPLATHYHETMQTLGFARSVARVHTRPSLNTDLPKRVALLLQLERENLSLALAALKDRHGPAGLALDKSKLGAVRRELEAKLATNREITAAWSPEPPRPSLEGGRLGAALDEEGEARGVGRTEALLRRLRALLAAAGIEGPAMDLVSRPHLLNISEDPASSAQLVYRIREGASRMGTGPRTTANPALLPNDSDPENDIQLGGPGVRPRHARVLCNGRIVMLVALEDARVYVNGHRIGSQGHRLHHGDRILLTSNHALLFVDPYETSSSLLPGGLGGDGGEEEAEEAGEAHVLVPNPQPASIQARDRLLAWRAALRELGQVGMQRQMGALRNHFEARRKALAKGHSAQQTSAAAEQGRAMHGASEAVMKELEARATAQVAAESGREDLAYFESEANRASSFAMQTQGRLTDISSKLQGLQGQYSQLQGAVAASEQAEKQAHVALQQAEEDVGRAEASQRAYERAAARASEDVDLVMLEQEGTRDNDVYKQVQSAGGQSDVLVISRNQEDAEVDSPGKSLAVQVVNARVAAEEAGHLAEEAAQTVEVLRGEAVKRDQEILQAARVLEEAMAALQKQGPSLAAAIKKLEAEQRDVQTEAKKWNDLEVMWRKELEEERKATAKEVKYRLKQLVVKEKGKLEDDAKSKQSTDNEALQDRLQRRQLAERMELRQEERHVEEALGRCGMLTTDATEMALQMDQRTTYTVHVSTREAVLKRLVGPAAPGAGEGQDAVVVVRITAGEEDKDRAPLVLWRVFLCDTLHLLSDRYMQWLAGRDVDPSAVAVTVGAGEGAEAGAAEGPHLLGTAHLQLAAIAHLLDPDPSMYPAVIDAKGRTVGQLAVEVVPHIGSQDDGAEVDSPDDLVGHSLTLDLSIRAIDQASAVLSDVSIAYCILCTPDGVRKTAPPPREGEEASSHDVAPREEDPEPDSPPSSAIARRYNTAVIRAPTSSPKFGYTRRHVFEPSMSQAFVEYLKNESICFEVYGQLVGPVAAAAAIAAAPSGRAPPAMQATPAEDAARDGAAAAPRGTPSGSLGRESGAAGLRRADAGTSSQAPPPAPALGDTPKPPVEEKTRAARISAFGNNALDDDEEEYERQRDEELARQAAAIKPPLPRKQCIVM